MDVGQAALRRTGSNVLQNALHPKHGLAWSDGNNVYLVPVKIVDDEVENDNSIKLGEFECVEGLYWSCDLGHYCYLCVLHQNTVSLWKVDGSTPDLNLKQIRKVNANPIPQGCLWSPHRDILCILSKEQCGFYFRHTQNKGSYALPPIESGRISCGCWSTNGNKLVVGIGSIILVYQWPDIEQSISDYTIIAWKIPSVDGRICSIASLTKDRMVCAAELPLDTLCKANNQGMLVADTSSEDDNSSQSENGEDVITIRKIKSMSHKDKLLNLQNNIQMPEVDSSQVILFDLQGKMQEPTRVASVQLKGIIIPDLLYFQETTNVVIVASNAQPFLQVLKVQPDNITMVHELKLSADERPKGICSTSHINVGPSHGALVMVGKPHNKDSIFLPSSVREVYDLRLQHITILEHNNKLGGNIPDSLFSELQLSNGSRQVHLLRINPLRVSESQDDEVNSKSCLTKGKGGHTDPDPVIHLQPPGKLKLMGHGEIDKELEIDTFGLSESLPNFKNKLKRFFEQKAATAQLSTDMYTGLLYPASKNNGGKSEPLSPSRLTSPTNGGPSEATRDTLHTTFLETQVRTQACQISRLQQKIGEINLLVEQSVAAAKKTYKAATNPDVVYLVLKSNIGHETKKTFVLDNGLLKYETVRGAFGLHSIELLIGEVPCILGSDADGFIPLTFTPNTTMYVGGRRAPPSTICSHISSMPKSDFNC